MNRKYIHNLYFTCLLLYSAPCRITSSHNVGVVQKITDDIGTEEFSKGLIRGLIHYLFSLQL